MKDIETLSNEELIEIAKSRKFVNDVYDYLLKQATLDPESWKDKYNVEVVTTARMVVDVDLYPEIENEFGEGVFDLKLKSKEKLKSMGIDLSDFEEERTSTRLKFN